MQMRWIEVKAGDFLGKEFKRRNTPLGLDPQAWGLRAGIFPKSASGGQLGLPLPLLQRTSALRGQQTERKRRE